VALKFLTLPFAAELQPGGPLCGNDPEDVRQARRAAAAALAGEDKAGGMRKLEPTLIVTVREAAFTILTGSANGTELLLSLYQKAFQLASVETGYTIETITANITEAFRVRSEAEGETFLTSMLHQRRSFGDHNSLDPMDS
jgi:hypothetical protein